MTALAIVSALVPPTPPAKIEAALAKKKLKRAAQKTKQSHQMLGAALKSGTVQGLWWWTWGNGPSANDQANANMVIAFSGWPDFSNAYLSAANIKPAMDKLAQNPIKFLALGGGNDNGDWTVAGLTQLIKDFTVPTAIDPKKPQILTTPEQKLTGWDGIAFDIEQGNGDSAAALLPLFQQAFALVKGLNKRVLVTTSHSAPYGFPNSYTTDPTDNRTLQLAFLKDPNIDMLSPQLYTDGTVLETSPTGLNQPVVGWNEYNTNKQVIPSIPKVFAATNDTAAATTFMNSITINPGGYIQWQQTG